MAHSDNNSVTERKEHVLGVHTSDIAGQQHDLNITNSYVFEQCSSILYYAVDKIWLKENMEEESAHLNQPSSSIQTPLIQYRSSTGAHSVEHQGIISFIGTKIIIKTIVVCLMLIRKDNSP